MDEIMLLRPAIEYEKDIVQFCDEIRKVKDSDAFAGCGNLRRSSNVQEWLDDLALREDEATCPPGRVPSTTYLAVRRCDHRVVGIIMLRHPNDHPTILGSGGHIGYSVRPSERRKGYATEMLKLVLEECRHRNMARVLVTCYKENIPSEKTILANGGVFENEIEDDGEILKRYWITL